MMKAPYSKATLLGLVVLNFSICAIPKNNTTTTKRRQSNLNQPNTQSLTHEQIQQNQHDQMCNILGYASNIFSNFVHLVSKPNDRDNIGNQVGNMAENIFHIVAQAAKPNNKSGFDQKAILNYLASDQFARDLTQEIIKILERHQEN